MRRIIDRNTVPGGTTPAPDDFRVVTSPGIDY
jgi:hypothetical protein